MILNFTEINMVTCSFPPFAVNITLNLSNVLQSSTMIHWRKIVKKNHLPFAWPLLTKYVRFLRNFWSEYNHFVRRIELWRCAIQECILLLFREHASVSSRFWSAFSWQDVFGQVWMIESAILFNWAAEPTFPVSLLSRFLIARSVRAQRARLHGPTFVNSISLSRLFAAVPAISAPILLTTWDSPVASTSLDSTVSNPKELSFVASAHVCWTSLVSRGPASEEEIPMRENTWPGVNRFKWEPGSSP